jgi:hypothetical protein
VVRRRCGALCALLRLVGLPAGFATAIVPGLGLVAAGLCWWVPRWPATAVIGAPSASSVEAHQCRHAWNVKR